MEKNKVAFGKQEVTKYKRITIRMGGEEIQTNTYILIFNQPKILSEVNIGYSLERVEQYIPASLRCLNIKDMAIIENAAEDFIYV